MIRYALCLCAVSATAALGQNADTLVGPGSSTAAARPTPALQATRLGGEIRIDGRLDEAAWTTADVQVQNGDRVIAEQIIPRGCTRR